jgi:hypothetical protein
MISRKPKFASILTKWEKRRIARRFTRRAQGKKPLAEPLQIAQAKERQEALKNGKMVFYDGNQRIELPLILESPLVGSVCALQGVFKIAQGKIFTMRGVERGAFNPRPPSIEYFNLRKYGKICVEKPILFGKEPMEWAFRDSELGHMMLTAELRGYGLGLKAASKTEREQRAKRHGKHGFESETKFVDLFRKFGYAAYLGATEALLTKKGKFQPLDGLDKFHRIEAIDPKTGKARIFTFPIKK